MLLRLKISNVCRFLGRNGYFKATGIQFTTAQTTFGGHIVEITPITSKGQEGRAEIQFPVADLPHIIQALQTIHNHYQTHPN